MKFRVIIEQDEDGMFAVHCPNLPGCLSQGKTRDEALHNIKEAIAGYLESLKKHDEAWQKNSGSQGWSLGTRQTDRDLRLP